MTNDILEVCPKRIVQLRHAEIDLVCGLDLPKGHAGKCRAVLKDDIIVMWSSSADA